MADAVQLLTPVGRFVMGNLYEPKTTDGDGAPLLSADKQTPRVEYVCGIAIAKGAEQHWGHTEWGQKVWAAGAAGWGNIINPETKSGRDFSWKIYNGDSDEVNTKGKRPCDRDGYKGHWVLVFTSGFAPKIVTADGSQPLIDKDVVKPGHYIQIYGTVKDNSPAKSPGVYLNLLAVAHSGFGPEITQSAVDTRSVGFGKGPVPAGASALPVGGMVPPAMPVAAAPALPQPPAGPIAVQPNHAALGMPAPAPAIQVPVAMPAVPLPGAPVGIPQVPVAAAPLAPPPPPPAPAAPVVPVRQMTALAKGVTYESYRGAGWSDEQLIANGLMTP